MSPFGMLFVPEQLTEAVSDDAWVAAMLGGLVCAERVSHLLAERLGLGAAHDLVAEATRRVVDGVSFRAALLADARVGLTAAEIDAALDPTTYLGAAEALVDRALERHAREALAA